MLKALKSYRTAFLFLFDKKLGWFLLFPLLLTVLVFYGGFSLTSWATKTISDTLDIWIGTIDWLPDWASVIQDVLYFLLWLILRIILYFVFAFFGGTIILLLMAPILTWLSEKVAEHMGLDVPAFSITQFMRDLTRAAALAIRNGVIQLGLSVLCFIIGFIPVVGVASPFLLFVFNAYFYGYNFMDYSLERRRFTVRDSNRYVWKHRFTTLSIGSPFALWMLIPFFGPMSAGFVAIFATVAATMETERIENKKIDLE